MAAAAEAEAGAEAEAEAEAGAEGEGEVEADGGAEGQGAWPLLRGQSAAAGPAQVQRFGRVFGAGWSDDEDRDEEANEREQEWAELGTIPHVPDDPDRAYA